jgi:hypothetical protein
MAKELKKFQAEFNTIEAAVIDAYGDWKMIGDSQGSTKKLLDGARLAIADRIETLKSGGTQGTTLADFSGDAEVKEALGTAKDALANYKQMEARKIKTLQAFKNVNKDLIDLADRMDDEIADRKKKLFEPKSLPDMVKLAKSVRGMVDEVGGLKTQSIADVVKTKVTPGDFEKTFWADLDRELKKSLSVRANAAATLLLEKFKPRLMKLRGDSVVTLTKETIELCAKAEAAHKKGQDRLAKISIQAAIGKADEVHGIVSGYSEAYNKNKSFLKGNPDHDTMLKFVSALTTKENQALKAVEATQKALK